MMMDSAAKHLDHKVQKATGTANLTKLIHSEAWESAIEQANAHPGEARCWSCRPGFFEGVKESDVLPIHEAVSMGAPVQVVVALVRAYPHGLMAKESAYRRLPIHIACRDLRARKVIRYLAKAYPLGVATDDILGRLPLHYSCSNGADPEIIKMLLESCPGAARAYDRRGWLPIHVACSVGASIQVVHALLDAFPPSVVLRTNKGSTPRRCVDMCGFGPRHAALCELLERARKEYDASQPMPAKRPSSVRLLV